jgi:hypothetical protein
MNVYIFVSEIYPTYRHGPSPISEFSYGLDLMQIGLYGTVSLLSNSILENEGRGTGELEISSRSA